MAEGGLAMQEIISSPPSLLLLPLMEVQQHGASNSDAIKIRDGIIFDFYMGLSHM